MQIITVCLAHHYLDQSGYQLRSLFPRIHPALQPLWQVVERDCLSKICGPACQKSEHMLSVSNINSITSAMG